MTNKLPTIDIKGKEYVMVKDRIIAFNERYPQGMITTVIIREDENSVVVKATIWPNSTTGGVYFTGHSEAYRDNTQMGSVAVEVAETSAVGRALAMMGIGIIDSVASADEVRKNISQPATPGRYPITNNQYNPSAMVGRAPSEAQRGLLRKNGLTDADIDQMDRLQASERISKIKSAPAPTKTNSQIKAEDSWEHETGLDPEIPIIDAETNE